jgi:hypothetical protein
VVPYTGAIGFDRNTGEEWYYVSAINQNQQRFVLMVSLGPRFTGLFSITKLPDEGVLGAAYADALGCWLGEVDGTTMLCMRNDGYSKPITLWSKDDKGHSIWTTTTEAVPGSNAGTLVMAFNDNHAGPFSSQISL